MPYEDTARVTQGGGRVKTGTETRAMQLRTEEHQGSREPPGAGRGKEATPPQTLQREHGHAHTLMSDFWPPNCERIHFCCLKPPSLQYFCYGSPRTLTHPPTHLSHLSRVPWVPKTDLSPRALSSLTRMDVFQPSVSFPSSQHLTTLTMPHI